MAASVAATLRPGPPAGFSELDKALQPHATQIEAWLKPHDGYKRGLKLTKVHALLLRHGVKVTYPTLRRFATKHLGYGEPRTTVRVADVDPGELAEVDFGKLGRVYDAVTQRVRVLHALVVTLVFSRHQFVYVTFDQDTASLITGLELAWESFGGVAARVVLDNLKAAVIKADRYEPSFQRTFNDYARHRGFVIDAAVVRHATGKPHVERQVPYVRESFFRGEQWRDRDHVQREAQRWCIGAAGRRIHGTIRKRPIEQFEAFERAALVPLTRGRFDTPQWATLKVHNDHHVRFDYALYSVPEHHEGNKTLGRKVTVRGDSALVRIYLDGHLLRTHPRLPHGKRSTHPQDYPKDKVEYAMRDAPAIIERATKQGDAIGKLCTKLLDGTFPWAHLRQAVKLLRLVEIYGAHRVEAACRRALAFDLISVHRVEDIIVRVLENHTPASGGSERPAQVIELAPLRFLRSPSSFNHSTTKEK